MKTGRLQSAPIGLLTGSSTLQSRMQHGERRLKRTNKARGQTRFEFVEYEQRGRNDDGDGDDDIERCCGRIMNICNDQEEGRPALHP